VAAPEFFNPSDAKQTATAHFDEVHNVCLVVAGRKRFFIRPPQSLRQRCQARDMHGGTGLDQRAHELPGVHPGEQPDAWLLAELEAGDVLVLPKYWWHYVLSDSATAMINLWSDERISAVNLQRHGNLIYSAIVDGIDDDWGRSIVSSRTSSTKDAAWARTHDQPEIDEITWPLHDKWHDYVRGSDRMATIARGTLPPENLVAVADCLLPTVRQVAQVLDPRLQVQSVTVIIMHTGLRGGSVERSWHIDPAGYDAVITVALSGSGSIQFRSTGHDLVTLDSSVGALVAMHGYARTDMQHRVLVPQSNTLQRTQRVVMLFRLSVF
jgi:hypothetical protein